MSVAYLTGQDGRRYRVVGAGLEWNFAGKKNGEFSFQKELGTPGRCIHLTNKQQTELDYRLTKKLERCLEATWTWIRAKAG